MYILKEQDLDAIIPIDTFSFTTTADLVIQQPAIESEGHGWVAQSEAKKAALFGLSVEQRGFNILVLGAQGSGRTSLMQSAMKEVASQRRKRDCLRDLVALYDFGQLGQPTLLKLAVGLGAKLRAEMDEFVRALIAELPQLVATDSQQEMLEKAEKWLSHSTEQLIVAFKQSSSDELLNYFKLIPNEVMSYLKAWQPPLANEAENALESLLNESFFARFRVNLMVDHRATEADDLTQAVVYDNDPSLQSLFGGIESTSDASLLPDFIRQIGRAHV